MDLPVADLPVAHTPAVDPGGARLTCRRTLAWSQTDAAGHNHFTALFAWLEEAEQALWQALGHAERLPSLPRDRVGADYLERLATQVLLDGRTVQQARHVVAHTPDRALPWPDDVRAALVAPRRHHEGAAPSTVGGQP